MTESSSPLARPSPRTSPMVATRSSSSERPREDPEEDVRPVSKKGMPLTTQFSFESWY